MAQQWHRTGPERLQPRRTIGGGWILCELCSKSPESCSRGSDLIDVSEVLGSLAAVRETD